MPTQNPVMKLLQKYRDRMKVTRTGIWLKNGGISWSLENSIHMI